jgi:DMSO/TMAO reductase YedYZ heme-binding membrane subunit
MDGRQLRNIGILLGFLIIALASVHFYFTFKEGNPSWNLVIMICGMVLLLYYTLVRPRRR